MKLNNVKLPKQKPENILVRNFENYRLVKVAEPIIKDKDGNVLDWSMKLILEEKCTDSMGTIFFKPEVIESPCNPSDLNGGYYTYHIKQTNLLLKLLEEASA
jgi:hypothetical protein